MEVPRPKRTKRCPISPGWAGGTAGKASFSSASCCNPCVQRDSTQAQHQPSACLHTSQCVKPAGSRRVLPLMNALRDLSLSAKGRGMTEVGTASGCMDHSSIHYTQEHGTQHNYKSTAHGTSTGARHTVHSKATHNKLLPGHRETTDRSSCTQHSTTHF